MTDEDLAERFIDAYESALRWLNKQHSGQRFSGLGQAAHKLKSHSIVREHREMLLFLNNLRNTIQHEARFGGRAIATPRIDAVEAMEQLAEIIERPPLIHKFMVRDLRTVTNSTPLPEVARIVIQDSLSQVPVVDEAGRFRWLLTTNALARWMGAKYEEDDGILIEQGSTVADVRPFGEEHDVAETVPPTLQARRACGILTRPQAPSALIITTDGASTGEIQGILTRFDVPRVLHETTVHLGK